MTETVIAFTLNGDAVQVSLKSADRPLVDVLREDLRLTGTKRGCGNGYCGTCAVLVNGAAVSSCLQLAVLVDGAEVRTIEGLGNNNRLHPVQAAFVQKAAFQCGICTPAHVLAACALLEQNPNPTDAEIVASVDGYFCRCTGYYKIIEAIREASKLATRPA